MAPSARNVTEPNFASGVNHLRGQTNETARQAGVSNVRNGIPLPPCLHENSSLSLRAAYAVTKRSERSRLSALVRIRRFPCSPQY
jgi:hypothetical protein